MRTAFLFDFDGTITMRDTSELVLSHFADSNWQVFDEMMDRGEITVEECMKRQFSLVEVPPESIINYLEDKVEIRTGFRELAKWLIDTGEDIAIVSAGMDFVIEHQLEKMGLFRRVKIISGKSWYDGHINFEFPEKRNIGALDFKHDAVLDFLKKGWNVAYTGDGSSDYNAVRIATFRFPIKGSRLEKMCMNEGIPHISINDFIDLKNDIF
ncbi:MAG: 2-hydroxy-3-keto-5-methylthiopentenyl-1-phosphate phosphatase [Methanomassiliicoccales archaeon PtaU1.Bin124]|nr:MAG: 2-hydroxy-3-keto-5-methylthiopentenyl-1-phosphate phosphatase [Methanomassiliicoccales archaeon PtaU1.Bin124]